MGKKARVGKDRVFHNERQRLLLSGTDVDIRKKVFSA